MITITFMLAASHFVPGQQLMNWPSDYYYFSRVDNQVISQASWKKSRQKRIYINDIPIDSTAISFNDFIFVKGSKSFFGFVTDSEKLQVFRGRNSGLNKIFDRKDTYFISGQNFKSRAIFIHDYDALLKLDQESKQFFPFLALHKYGSHELIEMTFSPQLPIALISLGEDVGGGYDTWRFIILDIGSGTVRDVTQKISKDLPPGVTSYISTGLINVMESRDHIFMNSDAFLNEKMFDYFVFDSEFNLVGRSLAKALDIGGVNFKKEKFISYNLEVRLDSRNVLLEYMPSFDLEKLFYRIYYDSAINSEDLRKLSKAELRLVKNFVFAKHNFGFDDEYLQAYYNTFAFYNQETKRKTRSKDVNHLLTEMDKRNLTLMSSK